MSQLTNIVLYFTGDLAEVAVLQVQQYNMDVQVGIAAKWNNKYLPTKLYFYEVPYYLIENRSWQITNAEILGGIDGCILNLFLMCMSSLKITSSLLTFLINITKSNNTCTKYHY